MGGEEKDKEEQEDAETAEDTIRAPRSSPLDNSIVTEQRQSNTSESHMSPSTQALSKYEFCIVELTKTKW